MPSKEFIFGVMCGVAGSAEVGVVILAVHRSWSLLTMLTNQGFRSGTLLLKDHLT